MVDCPGQRNATFHCIKIKQPRWNLPAGLFFYRK